MEHDERNINSIKIVTGSEYECKICQTRFSTLPECLKHELLDHSDRNAKRSSKSLRNKLKAIVKTFSNDAEQSVFDQSLREAIAACNDGSELSKIFRSHRMDTENLELVYCRIQTCLQGELNKIGSFQIFPFGSIVSGLSLRNSDIDVYIKETEENSDQRTVYKKICKALYRSSCFSEIRPIREARVPIIKCVHTSTGFSLDINNTGCNSVVNSEFLRALNQWDKRIHQLMLFLKIWSNNLKMRSNSNMTSFCLATLIIFYLQNKKARNVVLQPLFKLQANTQPNYINGVNYAIDLERNQTPLSKKCTVLQLIKGFFEFYSDIEFEKIIIAPYLGITIAREDFISGKFIYPQYENQLRALSIMHGTQANKFDVDRLLCVQDSFCLNMNVAPKAMSTVHLNYFRNCIKYAHRICTDPANLSGKKIYESLLFDIIEQITKLIASQAEAPIERQSLPPNLPNVINFKFVPCRADIKCLSQHPAVSENLTTVHKLWVQHYMRAITEIITDIYKIDMLSVSPTHQEKYRKLEDSQLSNSWLISASVDLWTGRIHQKTGKMTYMEYQKKQTEQLLEQRRQDSAYAVKLSGYLTISVICNHGAIEIELSHRDKKTDMCKKDPLRKFFAIFKNSLQNFSLKEEIQSQAKQTQTIE